MGNNSHEDSVFTQYGVKLWGTILKRIASVPKASKNHGEQIEKKGRLCPTAYNPLYKPIGKC